MKKVIVYCLLSVSLFACKKGLMTHEAAREAAEEFYSMLIEGNYKGFVEGYADAENMPEDFRSQLAAMEAGVSDDEREAIAALPSGSALLVVRRGPNVGARFLAQHGCFVQRTFDGKQCIIRIGRNIRNLRYQPGRSPPANANVHQHAGLKRLRRDVG